MHRNHDFLNAIEDIPPKTFEALKSISKFKKVSEGTQLVRQNEIPSKVYMLVSGIIRCYLATESGKEFNKSFYLPTSFVGSLTALMQRKPSFFVFEALTDCKLYEIDYYKLMEIRKADSKLNALYTKILENLYVKYERRLVELISLDAKERYLVLRDHMPEVDDLIPQYHIASYLGITPVQLSRIRKNLDIS